MLDLSAALATELTPLSERIAAAASAFVATVDEIMRFGSAHLLEAYLGVVPSERSSAERRQLGRIAKGGNGRMRWLLVEAAWRIPRSRLPETTALRAWPLTIAQRRGKRIAAVALCGWLHERA